MSLDEKYSHTGSIDRGDSKNQDHGAHLSRGQVDEAAVLAGSSEAEIDPVEAKRVKRKIDWHLLPLMCRELPYHLRAVLAIMHHVLTMSARRD